MALTFLSGWCTGRLIPDTRPSWRRRQTAGCLSSPGLTWRLSCVCMSRCSLRLPASRVLIEGARPTLGAQSEPRVALTGRVSSAEEGPMEGVLVSAKRAGSTVTTTVVTDREGRYRVSAGTARAGCLRPPHPGHRLRPRNRGSSDAGEPSKPTTADLKLSKDARPRLPADQRRVAGELPGHRRAEDIDPRLRPLPHAGARHPFAPRRERRSCPSSSGWPATRRSPFR